MTTETPREKVLTEAAELITGDRNETYGPPTQNFENIAAHWNTQIGHKLKEPLTAAEVAQLMALLKLARMIAQPKQDNYTDAIGYLACGWECEEAAEVKPEATKPKPRGRSFTSFAFDEVGVWTKQAATSVDLSAILPLYWGRSPVTPRYWRDSTGWYYRWDGSRMTYVTDEFDEREDSVNRTPEEYLAKFGKKYGAKEVSAADVPEWAR